MGTMSVMDKSGDSKIMWDRNNSDEVKAAKEQFDNLLKKGFAAYSVKKDGKKDELITDFDPKQEALILVPRMVGG